MIKSGKMLLVFSSKTCLPCLDLEEKVARVTTPKDDVLFLTLDTDPQLFKDYNVYTLPVLILATSDGKELKRSVGDIPVNKLREFLQ